jgi:hypothetical protein
MYIILRVCFSIHHIQNILIIIKIIYKKCNLPSTLRCRYFYYLITKLISNMLYVFNVEELWKREVS